MYNLLSPLTLVGAFAFGAASAYFAHRRGRSPYKWFFLGFFFGIFGLFAVGVFLPPVKREKPILPPQPEPGLLGPTHRLWYYLDANHQQVGPMSHNALSDSFKKGTISPATYVWNEEMEEWKSLKEFVFTKTP